MTRDIHQFTSSCSVCAKVPQTVLLPGKLFLLLTPQTPWSHIAIDFITDLSHLCQQHCHHGCCGPVFQVSTADSTARPAMSFETAKMVFKHVFLNYGTPEDPVSYWGHQFTSCVWKDFMEKLGVLVSLTSGYHPLVNVQLERANQEIGYFVRTFRGQGMISPIG